MRRITALACRTALASLFLLPQEVSADTVTCTYDVLGRSIASSVSEGSTAHANIGIAYDPAGNRAL